MSYNLWKPVSDKNGNAVILFTQNMGDGLVIQDADTGRVIETVTFDTIANGGRYHYRLKHPGSYYKNVFIIGDNGQGFYVGDGSKTNDSFTLQTFTKNSSHITENGGPQYDVASGRKEVTGNISDEGYSNVYGIKGVGNVAAPQLLDPASLGKAQIEFTDPIDTLRNIAKENKGQLDANFITSLAQAGVLNTANAQMLTDYLDMLSPQQQQLIGIENAFNQKQQIKAAEAAQPGITDLLRGEVKNAQTLASGRLLKDSEDRALEQTARSAGADAAWTRGLGDDSLVGKRLSDQLSVSQRLQVMQAGQNYMNTAVQLANQTLMDTPIKAGLSNIPNQLQPIRASELSAGQQQMYNALTTTQPDNAINAYINQRTNQAQLDSTYYSKLMDIEAANVQAINNFNQQVINDTNQTNAANAKAEATKWALWLKQHNKKASKDFDNIMAVIEATGTFDPLLYDKDFWKHYNQQTQDELEENSTIASGDTSGSKTPTDTTSGGGSGSGGSSGGGSEGGSGGGSEGGSESTTYNKSLNNTPTEPTSTNKKSLTTPSYNTKKLVQSNGTITLPTYNYNFKTPTTAMDYLQFWLQED